MHILLTGGGTGGHVIPNIALLDSFKRHHVKVSYMGGANSIEERLISRLGIDFYPVSVIKFERHNMLKNLAIPHVLRRGIREAKAVLKRIRPDAVFSKGGYVSLPPAYAAKALKIPVITHESDSTLGMANRLISSFSKLTIVTNPNIKIKRPHLIADNPIRERIFKGNRDIALANLRYTIGLKFLLILGGSQGARSINNFVYSNIDELTKRYNVIHITGKSTDNLTHNNYTSMAYSDNIEDLMALSDLVISRCGAGAVAELTALHKNCLFIPLENKSSRGDQMENAVRLEKNNLALVLREKDMNIDNVMHKLSTLEQCNLNRIDYDRDTPECIVEAIMRIASGNTL